MASDESGVCRAEDGRDGGRQIFCRAEGRAEGRSSAGRKAGRKAGQKAYLLLVYKADLLQVERKTDLPRAEGRAEDRYQETDLLQGGR